MTAIAIGQGLTFPRQQGGGGSSGDPDRFMFFASRTRMVSGYAVDTTSINLTYFASKLKYGSASYKCRTLMAHFSGFAMNEGLGPQETIVPGNDVVIDGADLIVRGVTYPADFSGNPIATIVSGSKGAWCSWPTFTGDLNPEEDFQIITRWHVASVGQKFVGPSRIQKHRGEKYWAAADASALAALIAADAPTTTAVDAFYCVAPGNQTNSQLICYGPDILLAKGDWNGRPVVLSPGDSIGYGRQEISGSADSRGNLGWESKWLDNPGGIGRIPHMIIGCPSAQSARELATSAFLRWDILDDIKAFNNGKYPFTVVLNQMGTNDSNVTISTWKARMTGLISRIKTRLGAGMKVIQCTIPPQNSLVTGNLGFDASGFTVAAIWTNAGGRGSINSDIRTNNAFGHDGFIDIDAAWIDPANTDKFMNASGIGQIGTMVSYTPGDGGSVLSSGVISGYVPKPGDALLVEYQPATYGARLVQTVTDNGDNTYTCGFTANSTTVFQANAKIYWAISPEGIHPHPAYVDNWLVPRLPQSEKVKLVP
ncbi:hypothetical protein FHX08_004765 [Rhizobium sp. BK529]|uniref:hypothetical protein n=1 Tax=Rhizobium sp. BK529 TaxID=2586983 RepID=UPI00161DDCDA|nr:hypothetical protein [Rhizobium sp. BK529]MBB3594361.1 hypothetical protein [Rhizobium sp. BK529]